MNRLTEKFLKLATAAVPAMVTASATPAAKADPITFSTFKSFDNINAAGYMNGSIPLEYLNYSPYTNSLVGSTLVDGVVGNGSVYNINLTTGKTTSLSLGTSSFSGEIINGPILVTPGGNYFNAQWGGVNDGGVLGFMPITGGVLSAYYDNGNFPYCSPVLGADGKIYTSASNGLLTVAFSGNNATFTTVAPFNNNQPFSGITAHGDSLYWVTPGAVAATVAAYNTQNHSTKTIATFDHAISPAQAPQFDAAGNMYVMASYSDDNDPKSPAIQYYKISPGATTPQKLLSISLGSSNSISYDDSFIVDPKGDLFFLFKNRTTGQYSFDEFSTEGVLTSTPLPAGIGDPGFSLTYDPDNKLIYGTTENGGDNGLGSIFSIANSGYQELPEPAGLALGAVAAVALLGRHRRQSQPALSM